MGLATLSEDVSDMKIQISTSAARLTAKLLMSKQYGTFHGGMQKVSSIDTKDVLWTYVGIVAGKTTPVMSKEEAVGIVANNKLYKF